MKSSAGAVDSNMPGKGSGEAVAFGAQSEARTGVGVGGIAGSGPRGYAARARFARWPR